MFEKFWPSFFLFLFAVLLLFALARPDMLLAALTVTGSVLLIALWLLLGAACLCGLLIAILAWRKFNLSSRRPVDGAFPLQRFRLKGGRQLLINPNTMVGSSAIIDPVTGVQELEPAAGWDRAIGVRHAVERTNAVRAMYPGDAARTDRHGAMSDVPKVNAGTWKVLDGPKRDLIEPRVIGQPPAPPDPVPPTADPGRAIIGAQPLAPAMGQAMSGEIVTWNLLQHPHARIHGASQGSGKTNLAITALAGLARQGAHLVILDRRRFKNFAAFNGHAELIDASDPAAWVETMRRLERIYSERDQMLGAAGAADITQLRQRLARYVVLVTEFGSLASVAEEEGVLKEGMRPLARIMREAGATGIHLIFEDQVVERGKWPRGVAANASGIFTGHLPLNMGAAGGYHHAHNLKQYEFHHDGAVFRAWDMARLTRQLLATAPAYDPRLAVLDGVATPAADGERDRSDVDRSQPPTPPHYTGTNGANVTDEPPPTNRWEEVTAAFFAAHPDLLTGPARGIVDLARSMADNEGNVKPHTAYKGLAHQYYHAFRANVRLPGGEKLGVDLTQK